MWRSLRGITNTPQTGQFRHAAEFLRASLSEHWFLFSVVNRLQMGGRFA